MPSSAKPDETENIQSVALTLDILELLSARAEPIGISEISQRLSVQKSRVFRHLRTLGARGYAMQDPESEKYMAGTKLFALGHNAASSSNLIAAAQPVMRSLMENLQVVVTLSRLENGISRVAEICSSSRWIGVTIPVGLILPFHATAHGKVALAFGDKLLRQKVFDEPLEPVTPATIIDRFTLEAEVARVRAQGWACSPGESMTGISALAAPLFEGTGHFVGGIGIVGSVQQIRPVPEQKQVDAMTEAAHAISRRLGFVAPESQPADGSSGAGSINAFTD